LRNAPAPAAAQFGVGAAEAGRWRQRGTSHRRVLALTFGPDFIHWRRSGESGRASSRAGGFFVCGMRRRRRPLRYGVGAAEAAVPQRRYRRCAEKAGILCPGQRRKNADLAGKVLHTPGTGWKSRKRFETTLAFRAIPKMSNNLIIQVFGPFRRDQFVAALDAINSEEGAWIERHRIP
jgi:hypothetical protein